MNFKRLKKWVAVALGTVMMTAALAGCGGEQKQGLRGMSNTLGSILSSSYCLY